MRGLTGSGVGAAPVAGSKQPLLAQVARDLLHDVQSRTWDDWEYLMEAMQELAKDKRPVKLSPYLIYSVKLPRIFGILQLLIQSFNFF